MADFCRVVLYGQRAHQIIHDGYVIQAASPLKDPAPGFLAAEAEYVSSRGNTAQSIINPVLRIFPKRYSVHGIIHRNREDLRPGSQSERGHPVLLRILLSLLDTDGLC